MKTSSVECLSEIDEQDLQNGVMTIKGDLAAESPIYIYLPQDKRYVLFSASIKDLLNDGE